MARRSAAAGRGMPGPAGPGRLDFSDMAVLETLGRRLPRWRPKPVSAGVRLARGFLYAMPVSLALWTGIGLAAWMAIG